MFSAKTLNQFRFQYLHDTSTATPQSFDSTLTVLGAFTDGGNASGRSTDIQNHYEAQNLTSFFLGKHTLVVGGRLREVQDTSTSNQYFNGTFTFPSLLAYQITEQGLHNGLTPAQIQAVAKKYLDPEKRRAQPVSHRCRNAHYLRESIRCGPLRPG